jgi:hypothetical protein
MDVVPCVAARTQAIGIEIDGASCLFVKAKQLGRTTNVTTATAIASSMQVRSTRVADTGGKACSKSLEGIRELGGTALSTTSSSSRQVAVYFQHHQASPACGESRPTTLETDRQYNRDIDPSSSASTTSYYDNVRVLCLSNEGIPQDI